MAREVLYFWATRELGLTQTESPGRFKMTQPAISQAARRGEELVKRYQFKLMEIESGLYRRFVDLQGG